MKEQNESVKRLEVGKDYISLIDSSIIVIDRKSNYNYENGFRDKEFKSYLLCSDTSNWREATEQEVIEAFKKHLVHRYGKDWETMKIKEEHPDSAFGINNGLRCVEVSKESDGWNVFNKNGLLYCNGVWVERLEEETKTHIQDATTEKNLDSFPDIDLVLELRKRGYEVTAEKTITIKL